MATPQEQARKVAGLVGLGLIAGGDEPGVPRFTAKLVTLCAHPGWKANWTVLVTLTGWAALLLGLVRMFTASRYSQAVTTVGNGTWLVLEGLLILAGLVMTWHAYQPERKQ